MSTEIAIDPRLFDWPSPDPRLFGSRCQDCGTHAFPAQDSCARCCSVNVERVHLASRGTLWSFTIQGFLPKSPPYAGDETPETFRPFGVGYVELPGQVRVEARLEAAAPEELAIGMDMDLVFRRFRTDEDGRDVITYAFKPAA